jgi:hypothetical protein
MYIYEMGKAEPVAWIEELGYSSGSMCSTIGIPSPRIAERECHYCGSMLPRDNVKCPNCGGEKRNAAVA